MRYGIASVGGAHTNLLSNMFLVVVVKIDLVALIATIPAVCRSEARGPPSLPSLLKGAILVGRTPNSILICHNSVSVLTTSRF